MNISTNKECVPNCVDFLCMYELPEPPRVVKDTIY